MAEEQRKAAQAVKYLMETVISALSEGLAKTADMKGDPVQNLGIYLLAVEAHKEEILRTKEQKKHWLNEAEKFKNNVPLPAEEEEATVLPSADNVVTLLMEVGEVIKAKCGASAVYFGIVRRNEEAEGDEDNEIILYEASTVPEQLERVLVKGQGVLWEALVDDEEEEEAEEADNPSPPKERKVLHIPSLLVNGLYRDRIYFWDRPMTGAFLAMPLRYGSYLFSEALKAPLPQGWPIKPEEKPKPAEDAGNNEENEEAPEEAAPEEETEVVPDPPTQPVKWIMCLDSTLTARDFSEHIHWLRSQALALEERLLKADQQEYLKHRKAEEKLEATENSAEIIGEINNLSHLVHIDKELLEKYHTIALAFGLEELTLVLAQNGKPCWRKILAAFRTLQMPLEVTDPEALRTLVDEVLESFPSAISRILKVFSDSTLKPTSEAAPEEVEALEPAA